MMAQPNVERHAKATLPGLLPAHTWELPSVVSDYLKASTFYRSFAHLKGKTDKTVKSYQMRPEDS